MPNQNQVKYVPAGSGPMYWGPADRVTFLVTGAEAHGGCFIVEGMAPPGGGPPPHIHHREEATFYLQQGTLTIHVGGKTLNASPGDVVWLPRGIVHCFQNTGDVDAKFLALVTPAGLEKFFEEAFYPATDRLAAPPLVTKELMGRMMAAAPKNGLEFVLPT